MTPEERLQENEVIEHGIVYSSCDDLSISKGTCVPGYVGYAYHWKHLATQATDQDRAYIKKHVESEPERFTRLRFLELLNHWNRFDAWKYWH